MPKRERAARKDARVERIEREAEKVFKLPKGAVQINNPNGKDARGDQLIGNLRKKGK